MSEPINPKSVDFEEASLRLGEGLKSCRAVLSDYRALLGGPTESEGANAFSCGESDDRVDDPNEG